MAQNILHHKAKVQLPGGEFPPSLAVCGGHLIAGGADGALHRLDPHTLGPIGSASPLARNWITELIPGHDTLYATSRDRHIYQVHPRTLQVQSAIDGRGGCLWSAAIHPLNGRVAVASDGGTLLIWHTPTGVRRLPRAHPTAIHALAWHPQGHTLYSGDFLGDIKSWDATTLTPGPTLSCEGDIVWSLAWDRDGEHLAVATGGPQIRIFQPPGDRPLLLHGPQAAAPALLELPDGRWATGSWDRQVRIHDPLSLRCIAKAPFPEDYAWRLANGPDDLFYSSHPNGWVHAWRWGPGQAQPTEVCP